MTLGFEKSHTPQLADLQKVLLFLWMKDGEKHGQIIWVRNTSATRETGMFFYASRISKIR